MRNGGAPEPTSLRTSFIGSSGRSHPRRSTRLIETGSALRRCARGRAATARRAEFRNGLSQSGSSGPSASCQTRAFTRQTCESSILPHDRTRAEAQRAACPARGRSPPRSASPRSAWACVSARSAWRRGTKGPLRGGSAAIRVRVGDGPRVKDGVHLPGDEAWLIAERRTRRDPLLPEPCALAPRCR